MKITKKREKTEKETPPSSPPAGLTSSLHIDVTIIVVRCGQMIKQFPQAGERATRHDERAFTGVRKQNY